MRGLFYDIISFYALDTNSRNIVVVNNTANPTQTVINNQFMYFAFGLVSACRLFKKYSRKNRYKPGMVALANKKSSGIWKK